MPQRASRFDIALIYLAGVAQGLALVSFPAASATFTSPSGFALSSTQYAALFVPRVVLAILSSALAPRLARRAGLRGVLLVGLAADLLSMALLTASALLMRTPAGFPVLCVATGALGLGFDVSVTIGRVVIAFLDRLIPPRVIYVALPLLLAAAFQLVAHAAGLATGLGSFAAAGLACSAILPFTISFAGTRFPRRAGTMSGAVIAFYQIGYGAAAFGVGPLRGLAGFAYATLCSAASILALALAALALMLVRPQSQPR